MVVTAGAAQAPLILRARALGCEVLAADIRHDAPSFKYAHQTAVVDVTDTHSLMKAAQSYRPDAILTEQTDVAVESVAFVAERLGLPGISYESAVKATNKFLMRKAVASAGLPTPNFHMASSNAQALDIGSAIELPLVLKPIDSQSSKGVTKVHLRDELPEAIDRAFAASRKGMILLEEMMVGTECSIESFVTENSIDVLGICTKVKSSPPFCYDMRLTYPAELPLEVLDDMRSLNRRVIESLGIKMGFTHAEMIVTSKGARLIEIAARGCGAHVATDLLPKLTGVDLLKFRILQALGQQIKLPAVRHDLHGILEFLKFANGSVRCVQGVDEARNVDGVLHIEMSIRPGMVLRHPKSADQRPGFILAIGKTREEVLTSISAATNLIEVDYAS